MKLRILLLFGLLIVAQNIGAISNYAEIYPPLVQTLYNSSTFNGDRHGEFGGDDVAILSDGSAWKVHEVSGWVSTQCSALYTKVVVPLFGLEEKKEKVHVASPGNVVVVPPPVILGGVINSTLYNLRQPNFEEAAGV